jgi:hypothetical protein
MNNISVSKSKKTKNLDNLESKKNKNTIKLTSDKNSTYQINDINTQVSLSTSTSSNFKTQKKNKNKTENSLQSLNINAPESARKSFPKNPKFYTKKFNNLSFNLVIYILEFADLSVVFQFLKLNKRVRLIIQKYFKLINVYMNVLKLEVFSLNNLNFLKDSNPIIDSVKSFLGNLVTDSQFDHIIQCILIKNIKGTQMSLAHVNEKMLKYIFLYLTSDNCTIEKLILGKIEYTDKVIKCISKIISQNKSIKILHFISIDVTQNLYEIWDSLLNKNNKIKEISVSGINEKNYHSSLMFLFFCLANSGYISKLNLSNIFISLEMGSQFKNIFKQNLNLKEISFENCDAAEKFPHTKFIKFSESLESLKFYSTTLNTEKMKILHKNLSQTVSGEKDKKKNYSIKKLLLNNIDFNHFRCGEYLGQIIRDNKSIYHLDLSHTVISQSLFGVFAVHLKSNKTLKELILKDTKLQDGADYLLWDAMETNDTLIKLDVSCNHFKNQDLNFIIRSLQINQTLVEINFNDCGFSQEIINGIMQNRDRTYII